METEDRLSILAALVVLKHRKLWIALTFFALMAAVTIRTLTAPKLYETHMKVLLKNERADTIVSAGTDGNSGYRAGVDEIQINSEIELLNSNNILRKVAILCSLDRLESNAGSRSAESAAVALETAVAHLRNRLKLTPVRKADVIQVDYSSTNPRLAAAVLQQLADSYLDEHLKVHGTPGTYQFFSIQASHHRRSLAETEGALAAYSRRESIVMLSQQQNAMIQKASDAQSALNQADASIRDFTTRIADTRRQLTGAQPRVVTQSRTIPNQYSVERLHTMLAELQNRRTLLLAKFRPDDRMVLEADKEIADTQFALDEATKLTAVEQATDVNLVHQTLTIDLARQEAELAGLLERRATLATQSEAYRDELMKLGNATATYEDLVRNRKEAEENYLLYSRKAEEARIAESLDQHKIANVAIAEAPVIPHLPSRPNVPLNLGLGAMLALFLSIGSAFVAEYVGGNRGEPPPGETVNHASDLEYLTGLPVLATAYRF